MVTTESSALPVEQGCKFSQLHMSVKHDHEHERTGTHDVTTPTTPTTAQRIVGALPQSHPGLCGTPVGPSKGHPRYTRARKEGRGWPDTSSTRRPPTNDIMTKASIVSTLFSETSAVTHLESYNVGSTAQHCRLGLLQDSDFAGTVKIQIQPRGESDENLEVTHLFPLVGCVRSKRQYPTVLQNLKLFRWMLD